jgi:hypothetical protein
MQILALLLCGKPVIFSSQTIQLKHETQKSQEKLKKKIATAHYLPELKYVIKELWQKNW